MCRGYTFVLPEFFRQHVLSYRRKYQHVEADFEQFLEAFDDRLGLTIPHCGGARKIRMASSDKGKGKSGSFRVVYFIKGKSTVFFLDFYDKETKKDVSEKDKKQICALIKQIKSSPDVP